MAKVRISNRVTDQDPGRPVAQALRELAEMVNAHADQIPLLADQVARLQKGQLTLDQIRIALSPSGSAPLTPPVTPPSATGVPGGLGVAPAPTPTPSPTLYGLNGHPGTVTLPPLPPDLPTAVTQANDYAYNFTKYVDGSYWTTLWAADPNYTWARMLGWEAGGTDVARWGLYSSPPSMWHAPVTSPWNLPTTTPLTLSRASQIIQGTAREFPNLTAATTSAPARAAQIDELRERTIWHLQQAGYSDAGQQWASAALVPDAFAATLDGTLRAFQTWTGVYTAAVQIVAVELTPVTLVASSGTAD